MLYFSCLPSNQFTVTESSTYPNNIKYPVFLYYLNPHLIWAIMCPTKTLFPSLFCI